MNAFEEISDEFDLERGGERHIRRVAPDCWVSVLHRLTGFGYMEWETAIVFLHDTGDRKPGIMDRDCLIIRGDHREELATMPKEQLREWYDANINGNRNSFETLMEAIAP
jgi:hypothetical protein